MSSYLPNYLATVVKTKCKVTLGEFMWLLEDHFKYFGKELKLLPQKRLNQN